MNKSSVKLTSFLIVLFITLSPFFYTSKAYEYDNEYNNGYDEYFEEAYDEYNRYDYYIKNMDVKVEVNDKREYIVTETIDAYFNERRHGIVRNIPKSSTLEDYQIKNITVSGADYSVSKSGLSGVDIKIGSEKETVLGDKKYKIKYTLKHYDDGEKDADYLYLNVLGVDWDVPIKMFTSTITYPNSFKFEDMKITSGYYGSTDNEYVDYSLNSNSVKIQSKVDSIPSHVGVTVNVRFEEGAFLNAPMDIYKQFIFFVGLLGVVLLIYTLISVVSSRGKIKSIPRIVEFYPPENISSLDMSYLYRGVITNEAIVSVIYAWASKGYIKIELDKFDKITLTKLKPLETEDSYEKQLFDKIFSYSHGSPPIVEEDDLLFNLGSTFEKVKNGLKDKYKSSDEYNMKIPKSSKLIRISSFVMILSYVSLRAFKVSADFMSALVLIVFAISLLYSILKLLDKKGYDNSKNFVENLFGSDNLLPVITQVIMFMVIQFFFLMDREIQSIILSSTLLMSLAFTMMIAPVKTQYEENVYGRIYGFKEFLERAEKDKLEMLINENPDYFYDVLPYAQALNVTDIWADKFKDIAMTPSQNYVYEGDSRDVSRLSRRLGVVSRDSVATKSSNASTGGGFSGGGFSGGGSGGGGGRSW